MKDANCVYLWTLMTKKKIDNKINETSQLTQQCLLSCYSAYPAGLFPSQKSLFWDVSILVSQFTSPRDSSCFRES